MQTKDIEKHLREIHDSAVDARNSANEVLRKIAALRQAMTEQEIEQLRKATGKASK